MYDLKIANTDVSAGYLSHEPAHPRDPQQSAGLDHRRAVAPTLRLHTRNDLCSAIRSGRDARWNNWP
jgi:hypothetical protein